MKADLVSVLAADGVRLDGALRTPIGGVAAQLGLDLVICHHGVGGNFYNPYFFDDLGTLLLEQGCAVLRVNNRGHDRVYGASTGLLGAAYEVVDDCRLDWRAWLDFAESAGYRRVAVWGHSLGAVKNIYYQSVERDARVLCAVASSPPRFAHDAYLESESAARFRSDIDRAQQLIAAGQPDAIIEAEVPIAMAFSARTYIDKYGPRARYDIFDHAPTSAVPLLVTLGGLEVDGLAFRDLAQRGPGLRDASERVSYALIEDADHSYASRVPELWRAFRGWLTEAGIASATLAPA